MTVRNFLKEKDEKYIKIDEFLFGKLCSVIDSYRFKPKKFAKQNNYKVRDWNKTVLKQAYEYFIKFWRKRPIVKAIKKISK